jgi:hypothetical protein
MAEIFQYINAIYSVRDAEYNPVHDSRIITTDNLTSVHTRLIKTAYDAGNTNALIFDNELYFTRDLADVNNNEIKQFLMTNPTWDVLIFNPRDNLPLETYGSFVHVHKVTSDTFNIDRVYLISRRFMQKVKDNITTGIETYYYDNTFVDSMPSKDSLYKVIVGKLTNISVLQNGEIKYNWTSYDLVA